MDHVGVGSSWTINSRTQQLENYLLCLTSPQLRKIRLLDLVCSIPKITNQLFYAWKYCFLSEFASKPHSQLPWHPAWLCQTFDVILHL
jgi:hypothetical protein